MKLLYTILFALFLSCSTEPESLYVCADSNNCLLGSWDAHSISFDGNNWQRVDEMRDYNNELCPDNFSTVTYSSDYSFDSYEYNCNGPDVIIRKTGTFIIEDDSLITNISRIYSDGIEGTVSDVPVTQYFEFISDTLLKVNPKTPFFSKWIFQSN